MGCVRPAGAVFFPLDEELELLPGQLTPLLHEHLVRLGAWMPFAAAAGLLLDFMRLSSVSPATARRQTEAAGAVLVTEQTQQVNAYEHHPPPVPVGPDTIVLSADGAMVPLVGGTWAEVKTLVIGELGAPTWVQGEQQTHTVALSYFSRLTDSADFERLALVETHRRGVESARAVAAVTDGAEWLQHFIDYHRPDAVRILDFPHAAEYISTIGAVTLGDGHSPPAEWFNTQLHQLKHDGPAPVLATLRALHTAAPQTAGVAEALAYLEKREALMQYPTFQAAGWPMGSGCVESANKLVVEARLKGSGMHWQRPFVNPMLAVRNVVCNNRWSETWPLVVHARRQLIHTRQATRRQQRQARLSAVTPAPRSSPPPAGTPINDPTPIAIAPPPSVDALSSERSRPAPNHPWRRMPFGKALFQPKPKG